MTTEPGQQQPKPRGRLPNRTPSPAGPRCPARCMGGRVLGIDGGNMSTVCAHCGGTGVMLLSPDVLAG